MNTTVRNAVPATDPRPTLEALVDRAVQLAMSRTWDAESAGHDLLASAGGDLDLLGRVRAQLLKTTNPHSQLGRRAVLALSYAAAAAPGAEQETAPPRPRLS
jgi:hypothetical protein